MAHQITIVVKSSDPSADSQQIITPQIIIQASEVTIMAQPSAPSPSPSADFQKIMANQARPQLQQQSQMGSLKQKTISKRKEIQPGIRQFLVPSKRSDSRNSKAGSNPSPGLKNIVTPQARNDSNDDKTSDVYRSLGIKKKMQIRWRFDEGSSHPLVRMFEEIEKAKIKK